MTRIIDTPKALLVEVPEGATEFRITSVGLEYRMSKGTWHVQPLPTQYSYGQPMLASSANECQAAKVVQLISTGKLSGRPQYRKYDDTTNLPAKMWTRDARHSLETLLRSHNLGPETTVVIPKN